MGVVGLLGWVQGLLSQERAAPIDWSVYKGKKLGIDILGFLYRAKSRRHSTLVYVARLVAAFRACGIHPVPIFDGKPPDEKQALLEDRAQQRRTATLQHNRLEHDLLAPGLSEARRSALLTEVQAIAGATTYLTGEERELVKQLFYICGIKPLNASGEADNTLAYLSKRGDLEAVISHDMDLLARGVETLLVPDSYALPGDASGWSTYTLSRVCSLSSLSYSQFVDMCVLMGCDYTHGRSRVHGRLAHSLLLRNGSLCSVLLRRGISDVAPYERAVRMLKGDDDTPVSLMNERQWDKWDSLNVDPEWETLFSLRTTLLHSLSEAEFRSLCSPGLRPDSPERSRASEDLTYRTSG
jgi:5'-3' exonuclease